MSNEIKNEFKEFISTLSTEICKEILLEELEKVNTSLNDTSIKYDKLYANYKLSIEQIKNELNVLDNASKNIDKFTKSINSNSKAVNESLALVKVGQDKSLKHILNENSNALEKYKVDIQKLNNSERNEFIGLLNSNLNESSKKYVNEISKMVNGSKMNQTLLNTEEINTSIKSANSKISLIKSSIDKFERNLFSKNEENFKLIYDKIPYLENKMQVINIDANKNNKKLEDKIKIVENKIKIVEEEMKSKNKIIIGLNIAILLMIIFTFLTK